MKMMVKGKTPQCPHLFHCYYLKARLFCGGKYHRNSIENDYCGSKPVLSPLPLILTLTLTLNPNPKDLTNPKPNPSDPTNPN